eukprot:10496349-Heterocapsa_arctica.AAC.1
MKRIKSPPMVVVRLGRKQFWRLCGKGWDPLRCLSLDWVPEGFRALGFMVLCVWPLELRLCPKLSAVRENPMVITRTSGFESAIGL